jgi:uncharacterized MAPEG superfamily protein
MVAFLLFLAQKLLHLEGQSSNTCTLVANFIVYRITFIIALIATVEGALEFTASP